ncbi:MAG TPA: amidase [Gemmatimonadales bacterium]|nr:amidase [Gemmatimonadales bacterium]
MYLTRREILIQLAALAALPALRPARTAGDPLLGTIADYQAGLRRGDFTAAEITAEALKRCRSDGLRWRAIDALSDSALEEAAACDARRRTGRTAGPMDGVPIFAKSIYDVRNLPTTASSAEWARLFPEPVRRDCVEVARMRAGGAVILGKTSADDFAYRGNGTSSHTGQALNPYDPAGTRTPGGSSAGAAITVAAGMAFTAFGTDDGGSNRIPAQFTGVVGMKPTFGLVPRTGVVPTWPYLDTHGPLSRNVADAALMLAAIAGADSSDPLALEGSFNGAPLARMSDEALAGVRLGLVEAHTPRAGMTPEALAIWDRALADVSAAGATVEPFEPNVTRANFQAAFREAAELRGDVEPNPRSPAPTANALYRYFAGRTDNPQEAVRRGYRAYRAFYDVLPATFEECLPLLERPMENDPAGQSFARSRAEVVAGLAEAMRAAGVTALVYPTMPFSAPHAEDSWPNVRTALGYGNWLGLPEVSVPAGYEPGGLPALNLSIVGLPGEDARVLALAYAYEQQSMRFRPPGV